ncbi:DUF3833 domain-containing protein [Marinobacterium mangrovicola]|uniref:Uncharacterized protein DUF3833 n=1 Tax=Marinobacterium mangrovicola TaxID=1476959 RepID=A0A4R1GW21_9GAMM|nr:DUF3833 domain-containing protein [Marinobacterium mangrovicola]TCK08592.1 uncharacterized protein DUF3833 [Marinobacterium mangrovicola]
MIRRSKLAVPLLGALALAGCSANLSDYREETPVLKLSEFFSGQLEAKGIVQDFSGKVVRRFTADIVGRWDEQGQGVLDELFIYADGSEQHRCWRLKEEERSSTYTYSGSAGDVVGEAAGSAEGNALNWQYKLRVPVSGNEWVLGMDDWMYLVDDQTLINRTQMSKWGIPVGEVTLYISKTSDTAQRPLSEDCRLD